MLEPVDAECFPVVQFTQDEDPVLLWYCPMRYGASGGGGGLETEGDVSAVRCKML